MEFDIMTPSIKKVVFPVGGLGKRFYPATIAIPKEMLPVVDRPLIDYAIEEARLSGIEELIFVTRKGKSSIEDYIEEYIKSNNLKTKSNVISDNNKVKELSFSFTMQHESLGLGHAIWCARNLIGEDAFAVLLADDFLTYEGAGVTADLVAGFAMSGKSQLSVMEVNGPDISKYGVVLPGSEPGSVAGLVEKPDVDKAPSNFASIGRYVLTPDIFDIIRNQPVGTGGEIQLADAINAQAASNAVEAVMLNGRRFDCGSVQGYLNAIIHVAGCREH